VDRLEAMSILVAAVEAGSLSGAGRKLGAPLPTISRKVSDLEAHLGTRLLVRTTRSLSLTDAGADYVAACRRILDEVEAAERKAAGEYVTPKGELTVTAPVVLGRTILLPVVGAFLARYPEIDVRMALSDRRAQLTEDHIDVAVRVGALSDSSLVATRVGLVRHVVCGSPEFFARHGEPKAPEDLTRLPCVTFDVLGSTEVWRFTPPTGGQALAPVRSRLAVNGAEAAIDAAIAGVGVTRVLSYQVAQAVADGRLRIVLGAFEADPFPVHLVHAGQGALPLKTRAFLDLAAPALRKALAAL
jgi:DNA-binding transcriptional LysR family regulator